MDALKGRKSTQDGCCNGLCDEGTIYATLGTNMEDQCCRIQFGGWARPIISGASVHIPVPCAQELHPSYSILLVLLHLFVIPWLTIPPGLLPIIGSLDASFPSISVTTVKKCESSVIV